MTLLYAMLAINGCLALLAVGLVYVIVRERRELRKLKDELAHRADEDRL